MLVVFSQYMTGGPCIDTRYMDAGKTSMVLSTLVSPTLRTESQPVVIAYYQKRQVVSRTHLKKTNYHGVRNTPLSDKAGLASLEQIGRLIRSLTGDT